MATTKSKLLAEGFLLRASFPAAMPFWVWDIEAICETDRALRLTEETILRLVGAGVTDQGTLAELMGLDDSDILPLTIGQLMMKNCLEHAEGHLSVTAGGNKVLEQRSVREPEKKEARLLLDPYRHKVSLLRGKGEHIRLTETQRRGLHPLPILRQPTGRDLAERHLDIQARLEADARAQAGGASSQRRIDLLKVTALGEAQAVFLEVVVEAWHRPSDGRWDWRLLVNDEEDAKVEAHFRECEKEGGDVLPLTELVGGGEHTFDRDLAAAFEAGEPTDAQTRLGAIGGDGPVSMLVPPFPFGYADLDVLLELDGWLAEAAEEGKEPPPIHVTFSRPPQTAESKTRFNPMRDLGELLRQAGVEVSDTEELTTRYGLLRCGKEVFVCHYQVGAVQGRAKGVPWAECRRVASESVSQELRRKLRLEGVRQSVRGGRPAALSAHATRAR